MYLTPGYTKQEVSSFPPGNPEKKHHTPVFKYRTVHEVLVHEQVVQVDTRDARAARAIPCLARRAQQTARYALREDNRESRAPARSCARTRPFPAVGEPAEAQWKGQGRWYPVLVRAESAPGRNGERCVAVSYEDGSGDVDNRIPVSRIRMPPPRSVIGTITALSMVEEPTATIKEAMAKYSTKCRSRNWLFLAGGHHQGPALLLIFQTFPRGPSKS